jgi:hypothetical protein
MSVAFSKSLSHQEMSFGERIERSIAYLKFKLRSHNSRKACETIENILAEQTKHTLFRKFFPEEWELSKASFFKRGFYENYSERTNEFFKLVHEKLFPILSGWNEHPDAEIESFPIFPLNIDLCCEDIEYEHLYVSFVIGLLFLFRDNEIWEFLAKEYSIRREDFPKINEQPFPEIWDLPKTGRHALYVTMLEVVDHSTRNPWLDETHCRNHNEYFWDEELVVHLSQTYKEAQEILEQTHILAFLFESNPKDILLEMIELWNSGKLPS